MNFFNDWWLVYRWIKGWVGFFFFNIFVYYLLLWYGRFKNLKYDWFLFFLYVWNYFVKYWIGFGLVVILIFLVLLNIVGKYGVFLFIMLGCRL